MIVRDYNPDSDKLVLQQIHRDMGMDYKFPDLDNPLFVVRKVYVDAEQIVGAEFLKIQVEAYVMLSCDLDAIRKTRVIAHLSRESEREAYNQGLDTIVAYIPEDISTKFSKRLNLLGWSQARKGWITWFRELI